MDKLSVNLKNCFGIDSLQHEFNFAECRVFAIYARNGLMKTSFAKTFQKIQFQQTKEIRDAIFGDDGMSEVAVDGKPVEGEDIFVIKSFESSYEADISSLLINAETKAQLQDVLNVRSKLLTALEKSSGIKIKKTSLGRIVYELEPTIIDDFGFKERSILLNLDALAVSVPEHQDFSKVLYTAIFDSSVLKKIMSNAFQNGIRTFIDASNRVYESFSYLEKGKLTLPKLKDLKKSLNKDAFFVRNNKVILNDHTEITNIKELDAEIASIDKAIKQIPEFKAIEELLTDAKGMILKDVIETHPEIIEFLSIDKLPHLKKALWLSYLRNSKNLFDELLDKYRILSEQLEKVSLDNTPWKEALDIFNKRFSVPFTMEVKNLKGAIIGESVPQIDFLFEKNGKKKTIDRSKLEELDTLSQGEKRALYLLNIIFEIEQIRASGREKILIIDDIADSFDYKNKYAIVEYLYELANENQFKLIILSHNFDFYRTISSRLSIYSGNALVAINQESIIKLIVDEPRKEPFEKWKTDLCKKNILALIPFVRNIVEYGKDRKIFKALDSTYDSDFIVLTSLLHEKAKTATLKFSDLQNIYVEYLEITNFKEDVNLDECIIPMIYSFADNMALEDSSLAAKLILAMAIRHKAEFFMMKKIKAYMGNLNWKKKKSIDSDSGTSAEFLEYVEKHKNQTRELFKGFQQINTIDVERQCKVISEVNIMTPENIHLNSFMYEPILDMDVRELLGLYSRVKELIVE